VSFTPFSNTQAHMQARMDDGGVDIMCPYDACDALIEAGDAEVRPSRCECSRRNVL